MTNAGPARTSRSTTLESLLWSTALAGTMVLAAPMARAQNTPSGQTVVSGTATFNGSNAPLNGSATNLEINLQTQNTIINWNRFSIENGSKVDFKTPTTAQAAVLNRVIGSSATEIKGALTSTPNIDVFLVNPNGILISGTGNVSTGSFVASTLAISDADFLSGDLHFTSGLTGSSGVRLNGGTIKTTGTGLGLILLGKQVQVNGTVDSGAQDSAFVAADDVTLSYSTGSPLAIQIDRGTPIEEAMKIVGGTIRGRNVYFAMATRNSLTDSLLQIDANVTAVAGTKGIVIVGGRSSVDPSVSVNSAPFFADRPVEVSVGGTLTTTGSGGVAIGGTADVTVSGAVTSAGRYTVRGSEVTLGKAGATVEQVSAGAVSITATDGDVSGIGNLRLRADTDGTGGQNLTIDADDDIDFGLTTILESGGAGLASDLNLFTSFRANAIRLGIARARTLDGGLSGGALEGKLDRVGGSGAGDVSATRFELGEGATIEARNLSFDSLTGAGTIALTANSLRANTITSTGGAVSIDAGSLAGLNSGTRASVTGSGTVDVDVATDALLGTLRSTGGGVVLEAGAFDVSSVQAVSEASLVSQSGNARVGALTVEAGNASITADDDAIMAGPVSVSGDYSVRGRNVALSGVQSAGGAISITSASSGQITNPGTLTLTANSDGVGTESLTLKGRMALGSNSLLRGGPARESAVIIDSGVANDITLGNVEAASLAIANGAILNADLTIGNVTTTGNLLLRSNDSIDAGALTSTSGSVALQAPVLSTGAISAATLASLSGRQVDFTTIQAATANLNTTGGGSGTRRLRGTSVTTSGAMTIGSDGGLVDIGTLTSGGPLNALSSGGLRFGTVDAAGTATLRNTGSNSDLVITNRLDAVGSATLASARDVIATTLGSDTNLTVTASRDVTGGGTNRTAITAGGTATVDAGGLARLGAVTANRILVEGGSVDTSALASATTVSVRATGGNAIVAGLSTTNGNANVTATGSARISGPVAVTGTYTVSGNGVVLGGTQSATGAVDITATGGTIGSAPGLVLTSNSDGVGGESLILRGAADLGSDSLLRGGPARQSLVVIDGSANGNFRLGDVEASSLSIAGGGPLNGSLTLGEVTTTSAITLTVNGGLTAEGLTSANGGITLRGAGGATLGELSGSGLDVAMGGPVAVQRFTASAGAARFGSSNGSATIDNGTATGEIRVQADDLASIGTVTGSSLTVVGGSVQVGDAQVTGAATLSAAGNLVIDRLNSGATSLVAGGDLTIDELTAGVLAVDVDGAARFGTTNAQSLNGTAGSVAGGTIIVTGPAGLTVANGLTLARLSAGGDVQLRTGAGMAIDRLDAAATVLDAGTETRLGTATVNSLTVTGGSARIIDGTVTGTASIDVDGAIDIDSLDAASATLRGGTIFADTLALSNSLTVTGGSGRIVDGTVGGTASIDVNGAIDIDSLSAAGATLKGGTIAADRLAIANALTFETAGTATLGTVTAGTLTGSAGIIDATDLTATGALALTSSGAMTVRKAGGSTITLDSGALATLGTIAGGTAVTVRTAQIDLTGELRAPTVTISARTPQAGIQLGGSGAGQTLSLSDAEMGRINADTAVFDGGTGTVTIDTLNLGANTGRNRVDILTTGDVSVIGTVSGGGAGRTFRIGGSQGSDTDLAQTIRIVATAEGGGRLLFDDADVELRGARIGLGNSGLTDTLFAGDGLTAAEAAALIADSNSAVYSALVGGSPFVPGRDTVLSAGRLTVRFSEFALFQNTGPRGLNTGVVLGGNPGGPALTLYGPGTGAPSAFALFGTINGIGGTSTAILGSGVVSAEGIDLGNARINGCVIGSAAGCLTTTIAQPTLNVFDPGRLIVVRGEPDFTIPFDPVIGSNNEALFASEATAADRPADCIPSEDQGCRPAQENR